MIIREISYIGGSLRSQVENIWERISQYDHEWPDANEERRKVIERDLDKTLTNLEVLVEGIRGHPICRRRERRPIMETQIIALLGGVVLGMIITLWIVSQTPRIYYR